ncbi:Zinc finger protein [Plakobranchus ocellatus]|uniref:Zinc finger protein n=1 Tax=Plakobranchus ocellatus TaxID=259542 RepID=A0AAV3ZQR7_9GAST|nr:Zinc finger protein [Plakobranchus ocellatus]
MENSGIITKSNSLFASSVVVVRYKKGSNRICSNYRWFTELTVVDPHPMNPPADMIQDIENDRYFSKINLSKGYWHISFCQEDIQKTAFVTMDCHFEFSRMPFGMMNLGATLTRAVKMLMGGMGLPPIASHSSLRQETRPKRGFVCFLV